MEELSEKQKLLAELYALRAGLSVISVKADEIREIENTLDGRARVKSSVEEEYYSQKKEIDRLTKETNKSSEYYEILKMSRNENIKRDSRFRANIDFSNFMFWIVASWIVPTILAGFLGGVGYGLFSLTLGLKTGVGVAIGAVIMVICTIPVLFLVKSKFRGKATVLIDTKIKQARQTLVSNRKQLEVAERKLAEIKERLDACGLEFSELKEESGDKIALLTEESEGYESALTDGYSSLLAKVDWENLDLVIYYLSTGRADTVKEALQQVDMQRRNEAILTEIRHASADISREIHGGLRALGSAIGKCFGALSEQLSAVGRQVGALSKINGVLINDMEINNSLRAKANKNSEELIRDMKYIQSKL